jgi:hypothetical protein
MQRLTRRDWLRIATAPIITIVAVVAAIIATDLATGGAHEPKSENQAALGPGAAAGILRPTPLPPPDTPTPTAGPTALPSPAADALDQTRKDDLESIRAALEKYYDKKKEYPSTGGGIQSMCIYVELDAGCKLKDFIDPIPSDPRGDPAVNGYWYISDGKSYTLIAVVGLPANATPQSCPDIAARHTGKPNTNLYCLSGSR